MLRLQIRLPCCWNEPPRSNGEVGNRVGFVPPPRGGQVIDPLSGVSGRKDAEPCSSGFAKPDAWEMWPSPTDLRKHLGSMNYILTNSVEEIPNTVVTVSRIVRLRAKREAGAERSQRGIGPMPALPPQL